MQFNQEWHSICTGVLDYYYSISMLSNQNAHQNHVRMAKRGMQIVTVHVIYQQKQILQCQFNAEFIIQMESEVQGA